MTVELKVVARGKKIKLSPHQISFNLKAASMGVPCFFLVEYHPPLPKKPILLLYRGDQARELYLHGVETVPVDSWPIVGIEWAAVRQSLTE